MIVQLNGNRFVAKRFLHVSGKIPFGGLGHDFQHLIDFIFQRLGGLLLTVDGFLQRIGHDAESIGYIADRIVTVAGLRGKVHGLTMGKAFHDLLQGLDAIVDDV